MFKAVFRLLASLHLALFLLTVLIVACAVGTVYESRVNAEVARHWVYNAPWFNAWLVLLVTNLFCAAAIRYPWKPHQTGFVITHAGIILLLIGGMIDRKWGVEGYVSLTVGDAPADTMNLREQEMLVFRPTEAGSGEPARTPLKIDYLANTNDPRMAVASGDPEVQVEVLEAVPIRGFMGDYEVVPALDLPGQHGRPGLRWTYFGAMMGGRAFNGSILLNDRVVQGPMTVVFRRGQPPEAAPKADAASNEKAAHTEIQFVFANHPDMPTIKQLAGPATGAKAALAVDAKGENPVLKVTMRGKDFEIPVRENLEKHYELEGLEGPWHLRIVGYYNDFIIVEGKKTNRSAEPKNPAVEFQLVGPLVEKSTTPAPDAQADDPHGSGAPGREGFGDPNLNAVTVYLGDDGRLRYHVKSRATGDRSGDIEVGKPFETFRKGVTFTVDAFLPRAVARASVEEMPSEQAADDETQQYALRCRVAAGGEEQTVLVPQSHDPKRLAPAEVNAGGRRVLLAFSSITQKIPFTVGLMRFHAPREQGSDMFRTFESNLCFDDRYDRVTLKADAEDLPAIREHLGEFLDDRTLKCAVVAENAAHLTLATANGASFDLPRSQVSDVEHNTHRIYMNNPTSYPEVWWGPWTGATYKFSQSSFEKGRSDFSVVQVLRDPGWLPKWVGCLMICFGIFTMFYLKPYFRRVPAPMAVAAAVAAEPSVSQPSTSAGIATTASASKETTA